MERFSFTNIVFSLAIVLSICSCNAQLSTTFYATTCPNVSAIVRATIQGAVANEARMAASLIRLHFHDCFVQGCDASILLAQTSTIQSEQSAGPNANSVRGFAVIEAAKQAVERACPRVVSCADILTLAARDASVAVGGPSWTLRLGRRDSTTANLARANSDLPGPSSSAAQLISAFSAKGLNTRDMVALSGAHTIGRARCSLFRTRIYSNGTNIDPAFATTRQQTCSRTGGDNNLAPLDISTADRFDNNYYSNLLQRRGLLDSDQILATATSTSSIVTQYSGNPLTFANDFGVAMVKMSEIQPTLGQNGIIRRVCSAIN